MYYCICNTSSTTGNARGAGTAYSSGAPAFSHVLVGYVLLKFWFSVLWLAMTIAWHFVDTFVLLRITASDNLLWHLQTEYDLHKMYHCICNMSSTTGDAWWAGTAYLSGATTSTPVLVGYVLFKLWFSALWLDYHCLACCRYVCSSSNHGFW